jgi:transposase
MKANRVNRILIFLIYFFFSDTYRERGGEMAEQIHKRFTDDHVKLLLDLYLNKTISLQQVSQQLECSERRFYELLRKYRESPEGFTVAYARNRSQHRLSREIDEIIRNELAKDRKLIGDEEIPIWNYNYAAIKDNVVKHLGYEISAQTVRNRAKEWGYYIPKRNKEKKPPREVVTEAAGMLLQHDSSHHKWSPYAKEKWTLITTLEDYSRYLLYGDLFETETTWAHIEAVKYVVLNWGVGLSYYVDNHSIFRFVCHKDSIWYKQVKGTDDVITQWKTVVEKCGMNVIHALKARGKGKIERPYRWLQDRIVRRCANEHVIDIEQARIILQQELKRYNEEQVHSTTGEIPAIRLERAFREKRNCFKEFSLPAGVSIKDIFCLHEKRIIDGYNNIIWNSNKIAVPLVLPQGTEIELHVIPDKECTEVRLWYKGQVIKVIHYKN